MNTATVLSQSLRLMRRELRHGLRGFGVFLTCIFLGIFAISAIGHFSAAARQGLLDDAGALLGGDLEITLNQRPLSAQQLTFLNQEGKVSLVRELRTMARIPQSGARGLVELKSVDDLYPLYGAVKLSNPMRLTEILSGKGAVVEKSFLQRFGTQIGDQIQVGDTLFTIKAVIETEPDRTIRAFNLGPRVMIADQDLAATGLIQPGSLLRYAYRLKLTDKSQMLLLKKQLEKQFPEAGWRIRTWRDAAPRVRNFLDRMETNLTLLGLCSLLVGGLGVTGAVRGYLGAKIHNIATLKCLGATRTTIFTTYLLQVLFLGGIGSAAGLALGAMLPWLLVQIYGSSFPLPMAPGIYPEIWALAMLYGLLIAMLFSLQELGKACQVSPATLFRGYAGLEQMRPGRGVRIATFVTGLLLACLAIISSPDRTLALWFLAGSMLCFILFKLLSVATIRITAKVPRSSYAPLRLAQANITRPGAPAGGILFSLGIGLTVLVMIAQIQTNLDDMVSETLPQNAPAYFFFDIQPDQIKNFNAIFNQLPAGNSLQASPTLRGRITAINNVPVEQANIAPDVSWAIRGDRYLSYRTSLPEGTVITAGDWWPETYQGAPLISLTEDLARGFHVAIGDTLTVNILGRAITAEIANIREVDWSTMELNFALIFAPGTLENAPQSYIAAAQLQPQLEEQVYKQVTDRFTNVSALSVREILNNVATTLQRIGWVFKGVAAIALLSGLLVLTGAVSADQHRRIRDAVILKVCGATRKDVLLAFASEFILLGFCAGLVSLLAGSLAAMAVIKGPLEATYRLAPGVIMITLVVAVILTLILGLAGTWKALGQKPSRYLRED